MTNQELSNEFDILYNNITSNQAPGLDEYEKSVFLTQAQEDTILGIYTGKTATGDSFESTEEMREYINSLVNMVYPLDALSVPPTAKIVKNINGIASDLFPINDDVWFITLELFESDSSSKVVVPIQQDDYFKIVNNPFRRPNNKRALKLDRGNITIYNNSYRCVEIIYSNKEDETFKYRYSYISKPSPIILSDLPNDLSINGISIETSCKLHPAIHRTILNRAVLLAKQAWGIGIQQQ